MHDSGGESADCGDLLRLGKTFLRLTPFRDVFTDRDDMRHLGVVEAHRNLRYAIRAELTRSTRLDLKLLHPASSQDVLELAAEHVGRLSVQDLEDRAANRLLARHALHTGFAFAVPRLNPILPIDHIQPDGQRIDDLGGESALLLDLHRTFDNLTLEAASVFRSTERRGEHVGDDVEEDALIRREGLLTSEDQSAQHAMSRQKPHADEPTR